MQVCILLTSSYLVVAHRRLKVSLHVLFGGTSFALDATGQGAGVEIGEISIDVMKKYRRTSGTCCIRIRCLSHDIDMDGLIGSS